MKVLIVDGGARGHALYDAVRKSPLVERVWVAPGTAGIPSEDCEFIHQFNVCEQVKFALEQGVNLCIPGSEVSLVEGIGDAMREAGVLCAGPSKAAAQLEGSKKFAMEICSAAGVPTPEFFTTSSYEEACEIIHECNLLVVKADGLCDGKGVVVADTPEEAMRAAHNFLVDGIHADAGRTIMLQEKPFGYEASFFAFVDGEYVVMSPELTTRDYKRLRDGDRGPNTGGMGAVAPHPWVAPALVDAVQRRIVEPVVRHMRVRGTPFQGVLYAGVMVTLNGPKLIEFNVCWGDPEAQAILPLIESDIVPYFLAMAQGAGGLDISVCPLLLVRDGHAVCTVFTAGNYPEPTTYSMQVHEMDLARSQGTVYIGPGIERQPDGKWITNTAGRVASLVGFGKTPEEAGDKSRNLARLLGATRGYYRTDIGL